MRVIPLRSAPTPADPDAVLARMAPRVVAWCRRLGAGRIDVEDAAQEVLVVLAKRLAGLSLEEDLDPWVFTVTRNVVRRHARRAWWRRWVGSPPERASGARSPETEVAATELTRLVDRALAALPVEQREVLVLCLVEDRSDSEAARLLGVPHGTVKSRLRLARAQFRRIVGADETLTPLSAWLEGDDA